MIKKIILGLALLGAVATTSVFAMEVHSKADIKIQVQALKDFRVELKHKIDAGEITKVEANEIWKTKVKELKGIKEDFFKKRFERIKKATEEIKKYSPELAEKINARLDLVKEKKAEFFEIKAKVDAGEITRAEAGKEIKKVLDSFKIKRDEIHSFLKSHREEILDIRKEIQKERREKIKGEFGFEMNNFFGDKEKEERIKKIKEEKDRIRNGKMREEIKADLIHEVEIKNHTPANLGIKAGGMFGKKEKEEKKEDSKTNGRRQHMPIWVEKKMDANTEINTEKNSGRVETHNSFNFGF